MKAVFRLICVLGGLVPLTLAAQSDVNKVIQEKSGSGYRVTGITTFFQGAQQKHHLILSKKARPTISVVNVPASKVSEQLVKFKKQGYRPLDMNVYEVNRRIYYSMIATKDDRTYYCRYGLNKKLFGEWLAENKSEYFDLSDFDGLENRGSPIFCGILLYDDYLAFGSGYRHAYDIDGAVFEATVKKFAAESYYPKNLDVFVHEGKRRYAASFVKTDMPTRFFTDRNQKQARTLLKQWISEGYFILNLKAYVFAGQTLYAACAEKSDLDCEIVWDVVGELQETPPDLELVPEFSEKPLEGPVTLVIRNKGTGEARDVQLQVLVARNQGDPKEVHVEKIGVIEQGTSIERSVDLGLAGGAVKEAVVQFRLDGANFEPFYESRSFSKE